MVHRSPKIESKPPPSSERPLDERVVLMIDERTLRQLLRAAAEKRGRFALDVVKEGGEARMQPDDWLM